MRPVPETIAKKLPLAAEVFAARGFEGTRIEDVAEVTGVPKATLYYYFHGKDDLLAYLFAVMLDEATERVHAAAETRGTARQRLTRVVRAQLSVMGEHPQVCQALVSNLGRAGRVPEIAEAIAASFYAPIRRLLAEGVADKSLRPVADPEAVASAIFGAVSVTALHYIVIDNCLPAERVAKQVLTLLLDGIAGGGDAA